MAFTPLWAQLINLLAAVLLLLAFAMLAQRRVLTLIDLFAAQGFALACSTAIVAYATHQSHLYWSAGLTLTLKVGLLPWLLLRMIRKLDVRWDVERLINIPTTMLITRRKAIPQVIGFLSMENGLLFAATSATYGMPMVVELGIALDVLVGV